MATSGDSWLESIAPEHVQAIGQFVLQRLSGEEGSIAAGTRELLEDERTPIFLGLRKNGGLEFALWLTSENQALALEAALDKAREELGEELEDIETVELCLTYGFRRFNLRHERELFQLKSNVFRGIRGIECSYGGKFHFVGPTLMLEQNLEWKEVIEGLRQELGVSEETFSSERVKIRQFRNAQILVNLPEKRAMKLLRGLRLIPVSEVTREGVERLQEHLGNYLYNNVDDDGRLVYMYEPGQGREFDPSANNMIRQWMATIAMARTGHYRKSDEAYAVTERNIRYNLRNFYKAKGSLGLIQLGSMVKLGAVSLAAIALVEHPKRSEFARAERKLYAMIEHLWQANGRFKTFYQPASMDVGHNFYPGEAMLAWSYHLEEKLDTKLLAKFMASYRHYRQWHLENRNPAFIPWHTQAYYKVYRKTEDQELADWIFEMNDWLIDQMQQWEGTMYPDAMGRFFSPKKNYGPPHASSTGVYMEGIIDAFILARDLGDDERRERYRVSLVRGLRSCMQLTYWDDDDMFFVKNKELTRGGVRTTVYNNRIRVDNVQHNLMAILKTLQNFEVADYLHP
jgi:hypothetical protein